jgi:hypothetical protein
MSSIPNVLTFVVYEFLCHTFHHSLTNILYDFKYERLDNILFNLEIKAAP